MLISRKCQYALRATFELAKRVGQGPVKIAEIAQVQAIPTRFLEVILSQLKQGGFVASQRGSEGGYFLLREPQDITVSDMILFVQGPLGPVGCIAEPADSADQCPLYGDCAFFGMWQKARAAVERVYDSTTLHDLVVQEKERKVQAQPASLSYSI